MTVPPSPEAFASALRSGDFQVAGDWLVRSFASEVFGLCQAIVRNRATAEDLSQEVFARAFAGLDNFRGDASARTWLLAIARNRCIDHVRAQQSRPELHDDGDPDALPQEISLPPSVLSRRTEIDRALQDLTEMERGLVVLRFRHGLAYEELASAFGLKTGTARMRVSRALAKMRDALAPPPLARSAAMAPPPAAARPFAAPAPAAPLAAPAAPAPAAPGSAPSRSWRGARPAAGLPGKERHALSAYFESATDVIPEDLYQRLGAMASSL